MIVMMFLNLNACRSFWFIKKSLSKENWNFLGAHSALIWFSLAHMKFCLVVKGFKVFWDFIVVNLILSKSITKTATAMHLIMPFTILKKKSLPTLAFSTGNTLSWTALSYQSKTIPLQHTAQPLRNICTTVCATHIITTHLAFTQSCWSHSKLCCI